MKNLEPDERETTITCTDGDDEVRIWTCQRRFITRLRHNPNFTEVDSGRFGSTEWAQFTIPADRWNPATGAKRHIVMSDEQRALAAVKLAERLGRVSPGGSGPADSVSPVDAGP